MKNVEHVLQRRQLTVTTTSAGRLFDAAAFLILGIETCDDEGEAAMLLESACDQNETSTYSFGVEFENNLLQLDWRPAIARILEDQSEQISAGRMAMRFHRGLAEAVVTICRRFADLPVVLGGGVFQNRVLVELIAAGLSKFGQRVGLPGSIPVNDGGLAAGQLAVAARRCNRKKD